jgi:hypothetical protein
MGKVRVYIDGAHTPTSLRYGGARAALVADCMRLTRELASTRAHCHFTGDTHPRMRDLHHSS